jgi:chaperonin cofactor prefoldin
MWPRRAEERTRLQELRPAQLVAEIDTMEIELNRLRSQRDHFMERTELLTAAIVKISRILDQP